MATATAELNYATPPQGASGVHASHMASPVVVPDTINITQLQQHYDLAVQRQSGWSAEELGLHEEKRVIMTEMARNGVQEAAWGLGETAVQIGLKSSGPIGGVVTAGVGMVRGGRDKQKGFEDIANAYMTDIVQTFGVHPDDITPENAEHYVKLLADMPGQDQLRYQVKEIEQRQGRTVAKAVGGTAGFGAGATIGGAVGGLLAPVTFGLSVPVGSIAGGMIGASMASSAVDNSITTMTGIDPNATGYKELMRIQQKLDTPETTDKVTAADVFKGLLAGDKILQAEILEQTGKKFDDLSPEQQENLLKTKHANLLEASQFLADEINEGRVKPKKLLTLNTTALIVGGAPAARDLLSTDVMYNGAMAQNQPVVTNEIVPFNRNEKPSMSISTQGAEVEPMIARGQQQGIGKFTNAIIAERQAAAMQGQQMAM